jgi:hypothetical protein
MIDNLGKNGLLTILDGDKISIGELYDKIQKLNSDYHHYSSNPTRCSKIKAECEKLIKENPAAQNWLKNNGS